MSIINKAVAALTLALTLTGCGQEEEQWEPALLPYHPCEELWEAMDQGSFGSPNLAYWGAKDGKCEARYFPEGW